MCGCGSGAVMFDYESLGGLDEMLLYDCWYGERTDLYPFAARRASDLGWDVGSEVGRRVRTLIGCRVGLRVGLRC